MWRFKTEQEFKDEGLWQEVTSAPIGWNSNKAMNKYLGEEIPKKYHSYCEKGEVFYIEYWRFSSSSYTKMETKPQIQFQQGKWYKFLWKVNDKITYGKVSQISPNSFNVSEGIHDNTYEKTNGYFYEDCKNIELLEYLSEIQEFLPKGHPDLIQNISTREDLIQQSIEKGYLPGVKFLDLVHNEEFTISKEAKLDTYGKNNQLYISVEPKKGFSNKTARIYKDGSWAKIINSSTMEKEIPDINSSKEELLEYAKKTYPTGTEIYSVYCNKSYSENTCIIDEKDFRVFSNNSIDAGSGKAYLFYDNIWAKKAEVEKKVEIKQVEETITPKFKPGDKVEFISSDSRNACYFKKGLTNLEINFIEKANPSIEYNVWEHDKSSTWSVNEDELQLMSSLEAIIPQGGIDMLDIQRQCKERFPIGSIIVTTDGEEYKLIEDDTIYTIVKNYVYSNYLQGCLYDNGKWAKLISLPAPKSEPKPKEEPKSLVGRYLKALVDRPNGGSVKKDEIGIITHYGICSSSKGIYPTQVNFPSQKSYGIGELAYADGLSYELIPEGFIPEEEKLPITILPKPKYQEKTPRFRIGDKVTVKDRKFDTTGDGWYLDTLSEYEKVAAIETDTGIIEKIITTKKGVYYKLSCHGRGYVKEEMLELADTCTQEVKSEPKQEQEDFIVGGYIRLLRDYKGVPKGSIVKITDITSDKRLVEFQNSQGDTCSLWTRYYGSNTECEWVGMSYSSRDLSNIIPQSIRAYDLLAPSEFWTMPAEQSETDLLIKPKKETENKKTKFDEQEFLSNPYNKEFKISKVKTEKKKTILNFN